jgi:2-amino-4-hydroxy-6-hydroxymethyldihydropteridine diphosphokinase
MLLAMKTNRAVFVGLGTNLPFRGLAGTALLEAALSAIGDTGVKVVKRSSFWASPALPNCGAPQPDFVNAVAEMDPGALGPDALWAVLAGVERAFGRERRERWAARTLDLDIIDFAGMVSSGEEGELSLPHPGAHERAFVLLPLAEIASQWVHPVCAKSALDLSLACLGKAQKL